MKKQRQSALLAFLDVDLSKFDSAETSSDESFRIENHTEESDIGSSDDSDEEDDSEDSEDDSSDDEPDLKQSKANAVNHQDEPGTSSAMPQMSIEKLLEQAKTYSSAATAKLLSTLVCCACLGDRSDDSNEIVECDGCKITVHEGCYGVGESVSVSSTVSSCSTEPWFCEACRANVKDPDCELCPNRGGIFKETDCGKWVHLVCALYVPGVAFGEVDQLSMVTLFEMQYNKWGAKTCSLCDDERFARTGVSIGCDAGMCKTYFHVTCAQKAGFLSEAHHEEADQADPFYAHCKAHSDKSLIKHRKRNYNALLLQMKRHELEMERNEKPTPEQERIERKLKKHRIKYTSNKQTRIEPWVPTQKMPRLLTTSASACKKLMKKAELMGIDAAALEFQEAQIASLTDIRKKWHIPPAFSTEFVGYYLDRSIRITEMKKNFSHQLVLNNSLLSQQQTYRTKYDDAIKIKEEVQEHQKDLLTEIKQLHDAILHLCPNKPLLEIERIGKPSTVVPPPLQPVKPASSPVPMLSSTPPPQMITNRTMSVPTAAALKMGVGFPLNNLRKDGTGRILSTQCVSNDELLNECGICKKCNDQHLLVKCDTCHKYYHLGCLNPPLTRHPKRSKLYAWQCSECDKSDDSAPENVIIPKGPRRSRIRYSKDGPIIPDSLRDSFGSDKSMSMSRKSDESHHKTMNGSELDTTTEDKSLTKDSAVLKLPEEAINEIFVDEIVPTTSTPIVDGKKDVKPQAKKRGRKPKTKVSPSDESSAPEDLSAKMPQPASAPSKELPIENQVNSYPLQNLTVAKFESPEPSLIITEVIKSPSDTQKSAKKGRPKKEKPSIAQISNKLQKKHQEMEPKAEVTLLDLTTKVECPLNQLQAFADIPNSIPYPTSNGEQPKIVDETEAIPVLPLPPSELIIRKSSPGEIMLNGAVLNGEGTTSSGHKHKKRKSHKRRHSNSPSSGDPQPGSKKHKHKRKRKNHDLEEAPHNSLDILRLPEQPRIKMKFCAKFVQAGDDKKIMWSLPNAEDGVRVDSFQSNSFVDQQNSAASVPMKSPIGNGHQTSPKKRKKPTSPDAKKSRLLLNISPNKGISPSIVAPSHFNTSNLSANSSASVSHSSINETCTLPSLICDVCESEGTTQNLVKCDECLKNYHFTCLIPPLKKTPKKRGYSWHCADCDPTDRENN